MPIDYRKLRAEISMADVLNLLPFRIKSCTGRQVRGNCPLHPDDGNVRCFSANLERNVFRCFECKAQGNHLDLWVKATRQPIHQAAIDLCTRMNIEPPQL